MWLTITEGLYQLWTLPNICSLLKTLSSGSSSCCDHHSHLRGCTSSPFLCPVLLSKILLQHSWKTSSRNSEQQPIPLLISRRLCHPISPTCKRDENSYSRLLLNSLRYFLTAALKWLQVPISCSLLRHYKSISPSPQSFPTLWHPLICHYFQSLASAFPYGHYRSMKPQPEWLFHLFHWFISLGESPV